MAAPDVLIRRCNVRLLRSAADGAALLDREDHLAFARRMHPLVMGMIEQFVAERIAREGGHVDIARLDIDVALPAGAHEGALPLARSAVRERVDAAVGAALAKAEAAGHLVRSPARPAEEPAIEAPAREPPPALPDGILEVLAGWSEHRQLALRLSLLGPVALASLFARVHRALRDRSPAAARSTGEAPFAVANDAGPRDAANAAESLRGWLTRVALWAKAAGHATDRTADARELAELTVQADRLAPLAGLLAGAPDARRIDPPAPNERRADGSPEGEVAAPPPAREHAAAARSPSSAAAPICSALPNGRYHAVCALPYLAFLRLAEHRVLAGLPADDPALAALAYVIALKLQPPPSEPIRPWADAATATAAVAAGLANAPDGSALVDAAAAGDSLFELASGGVNAAMRPALIELAIVPAIHHSGRVTVFDPVGYYPAGGGAPSTLAEILGGAHALLVFPDGDAAGLQLADEAGFRAACRGLPARGERFVRLDGPRGWRGMANVPAQTLAGHRGTLPGFGERAERGQAIWLDLTERRPLAAPATAARIDPLDRCAALIAGFALADIAYRLSDNDPASWHEPDPLLALDRFGDLSARIDVSDGDIAVTLPLGARFADLFAARLLDPTPRLPWLGGRVLRVGGG